MKGQLMMGLCAVGVLACSSQPWEPAQPEQTEGTTEQTGVPAPAEAKPMQLIEWHAENNKLGACTQLVLRVTQGGKTLAEQTWKDACETCDENSCTSTMHSHLGYADAAGRRFAWVETHEEWHDNGSKDVALWGYECGKLTQLWSYNHGAGEDYKFALTAVGDDWKNVTITTRHAESGDKEDIALTWDGSACKFVAKK